jgi:hypothetical protein
MVFSLSFSLKGPLWFRIFHPPPGGAGPEFGKGSFSVPEYFRPLGQVQPQGQDDLPLGFKAAAFPFFHPVDGQSRNSRLARQFGFAQKKLFTEAFQGMKLRTQLSVSPRNPDFFREFMAPGCIARTIP